MKNFGPALCCIARDQTLQSNISEKVCTKFIYGRIRVKIVRIGNIGLRLFGGNRIPLSYKIFISNSYYLFVFRFRRDLQFEKIIYYSKLIETKGASVTRYRFNDRDIFIIKSCNERRNESFIYENYLQMFTNHQRK
jgi:hypothetical protein